jgi:hypothetical protein
MVYRLPELVAALFKYGQKEWAKYSIGGTQLSFFPFFAFN